GGGLKPYSALGGLLAQIGARRPAGNRQPHLVAARGKAHLALAVKCERAQVAFLQPIDPHDVAAGLDDLLVAERDLHLDDMSGIEQAADMLAGAEDRRA